MTVRRAAFISAVVAALVYVGALRNRYALDDTPIVEKNPAAHSVPAALAAFDDPYWPPEHGAGQWRPLVILSFAADWSVSGGSPAWLHASNVAWHAAATALTVPVLAAYVTPAAALGGALLFAVHPVHVEAVANLVGRAEVMAAVWLLAAILAARSVRRRRGELRPSWWYEVALLGAVAAALLSKEHAAVAIAILALDDVATGAKSRPGLPWRDYAAVFALTVGWFWARRVIESGLSFGAVAPTFFHLDTLGRISTMLPVVFVLVRLLVWPFDLSPDYHPQVVERLEELSPLGVAGLLLLAALVALALASWRRYRAPSTGLFLIGLAWLPTANLLFPTGIVIAERTLYLASVGLVLLAAAGLQAVARRHGVRAAGAAFLAAAVPFAVRAATRSPHWRSNRDLVLVALVSHPESYRVHAAAARVERRLGHLDRALREYRLALELFPLDHYLLAEVGDAYLSAHRLPTALAVLRRAERLDSHHTVTQQLLAHVLLRLDSTGSALDHARRAVQAAPAGAAAARVLAAAYVALGQRDSALAVWLAFEQSGGKRYERWLYQASTAAALGLTDRAWMAFDSARVLAPSDSLARAQLGELRRLLGVARPEAP